MGLFSDESYSEWDYFWHFDTLFWFSVKTFESSVESLVAQPQKPGLTATKENEALLN